MNGGIKLVEINYSKPLGLYSRIEFIVNYPNHIEKIYYFVCKDNLFNCYRLEAGRIYVNAKVYGERYIVINEVENSYIFSVLGISLCNFSELLLGYSVHPNILVAQNIEDIQKILIGLEHYDEF